MKEMTNLGNVKDRESRVESSQFLLFPLVYALVLRERGYQCYVNISAMYICVGGIEQVESSLEKDPLALYIAAA